MPIDHTSTIANQEADHYVSQKAGHRNERNLRGVVWGFWLLLFFFWVSAGIAQEGPYTVSGNIYNPQDQQPLPGATTVVLSASDSSMVSGSTTDTEGYFTVKDLDSGDYILKVSYVGHNSMHKNFSVNGRSLGLGMMLLKESSTQLQAVEVVANRARLKQKGDTTVYFASAAQVGHGATARQLINKMAGMTARNGKIQAQGEDVLEIMVDGKRFFEGDLETALKMLPAESVQNIEVYNYKSERARLTGIDEGNQGKSINIVTKEEFRKSAFGRAYLGGGADGEYQGGGNLNLMNGDQRVTLLYQSNNVNQQNFAQEDVSEVSGASMSEQPGVSGVHAGGLDFSNYMGEHTEVSGTYLFKSIDNFTESEMVREYLPGAGSELDYSENTENRNKQYEHSLNMRLRHELNDNNTLLFQPQLNTNNYKGKRLLNSESLESNTLISESYSSLADVGKGLDFSAPVHFTHRFSKKGRTLSADLSPSYNSNSVENRLRSENIQYNGNTVLDTILQEGFVNSESWRLGGGLHYSEPISDKSTVFIRYRSQLNIDHSDDQVFKNAFASSEGSSPDSLLSNKFESELVEHSIEPEYLLKTGKHFLKVSLGYNWSQLNSDQLFPSQENINRNFSAVLPGLNWRFKINDRRRMNLNYRTSNRQPSAHQLQTVPNNTNPMRQYAGNESLQQEYRHSLSANYTGINLEKGSVFLVGINASLTQDFFGNIITTVDSDTLINNRIKLQRGGQLISQKNMDGYFMAGIYTSFDHPVNFLKSNFTIGLNFNYSKMPGEINGEVNWTHMPVYELNLGLTSNISKHVDFDLRTNTAYETSHFSLNPDFNSAIIRQETNASLNWLVWKGLNFTADVNHQLLRGNETYFDRSILLCNLGLGYKFLKNKQAELRITVFDLFNNNARVQRNFNDVYTDNYTTNVLQRYGMLTFTYRLVGSNK